MGAAAGVGLHDLRTGGQFFLELFQLQECGGLLGFALRGQLDGLGRFGGVEAGSPGDAACGLHGLVGAGAHGGSGLTGRQLVVAVPGLGGGQLELQEALVHLLVHVQRGGAKDLGHGVADSMHTVGHLLESVQLPGEVGGGDGGSHHVSGIHRVEQTHQHKAHQRRKDVHQRGNGGMDDLDHHHGTHAPHQRELKADIAADVEGLVGVVPPAGAVELIQRPSAHQLQGTGQDDAAEIQQQQVIFQRCEEEEHQDHAEAVDGADRAVQEAPVHQLAGGGGGIYHLDAPAQTGVDEEKRKDMIKRETADRRIEKKRQGNTSNQFCLRTI